MMAAAIVAADVAVLHVRELVSDHAFELTLVERAQDALGGRDRRVLGIPACGERIR
jgi:hypothetical protein